MVPKKINDRWASSGRQIADSQEAENILHQCMLALAV